MEISFYPIAHLIKVEIPRFFTPHHLDLDHKIPV